MSQINPHWSRWIKASVSKWFDDHKGDVVMFFEGDDRATDETPEFVEVRMDGPRIKELSKNYFRLDVFINVLIQCHMNKSNVYSFEVLEGKVQAMFDPCIPVFKYGNGADDNSTVQIGTLVLKYSRPLDQLKSANFGQIDEAVRLQQATVEGHYRLELTIP